MVQGQIYLKGWGPAHFPFLHLEITALFGKLCYPFE